MTVERIGESVTASSESPKSDKKKPNPDDPVVGIPINITVTVPISVAVPKVTYEDPSQKLHDHHVVNIEGNEDYFQKAMEAAADSPLVQGAITSLLSAAGMFKHKHPGVGIRIFYTPCAGVVEEQEI